MPGTPWVFNKYLLSEIINKWENELEFAFGFSTVSLTFHSYFGTIGFYFSEHLWNLLISDSINPDYFFLLQSFLDYSQPLNFLLTFRTKKLHFKVKFLNLGEDRLNSLIHVLLHILLYVICLCSLSPQQTRSSLRSRSTFIHLCPPGAGKPQELGGSSPGPQVQVQTQKAEEKLYHVTF